MPARARARAIVLNGPSSYATRCATPHVASAATAKRIGSGRRTARVYRAGVTTASPRAERVQPAAHRGEDRVLAENDRLRVSRCRAVGRLRQPRADLLRWSAGLVPRPDHE